MEIECVSDKENVGRPVKEMYRDNFNNFVNKEMSDPVFPQRNDNTA